MEPDYQVQTLPLKLLAMASGVSYLITLCLGFHICDRGVVSFRRMSRPVRELLQQITASKREMLWLTYCEIVLNDTKLDIFCKFSFPFSFDYLAQGYRLLCGF